jgi:F-type H+-transporting ATPase subunit delta
MKISKQARREAKELFRSCLADGALDENRVRRAVSQVAAARPRGYIAILSHFQRLVKLEVDRRAAKVESPAPLAPELEADLKTRLGRLYGPGLDFSFTRNPALIGGLHIKIGSDVYDGSIQARLAALQESF